MRFMKTLSAGAAAIALATALNAPAFAQTTTGDVRGVVTDASGAPISGATVTIINEATGQRQTVRTGSNGGYSFRNLNISGSYDVRVDSDRFADQAVEDVTLSLGDTTVINFGLSGAATSDEIVVVATRQNAVEIATGPAATFSFSDLQNTPAVSRDIKDIIRADPRLFIEESNGNGLQCAGASPRFNSLTVDGIRLNDNFGLNANGFPTERLPFPFDALDQVAVELAPFDVEYGSFTGCNINAVTRSAGNELAGSVWVDYTNDALRGGSIEGDSFDKGEFGDFRFGATIEVPLIKDKLFLFGAYEKQNVTEVAALQRGPAEAGSIGVQGVSQAQLDQILSIARDQYDYDPGVLPSSFGEDDEKLLLKLDYNINDNHRASFVYNYIDGNNLTASDDDPDEYEFFNHYYERSTELTNYSGQIFSNWTDNFSTEIRVSYTENDTDQISVAGTDFGEVQIETENNGQDATVYLGADDSRHSNDLNTETLNLKFKGDYVWNNHIFTFGYERETVDVFNLFVQHTETQIEFESIADFAAGRANVIDYGNAPTNNPADAAASFKFTTNTAYVQDTISWDDLGLTVTAGVRFDWYTSNDVPTENAGFVTRRGFSNTNTFDGESLVMPRLGITYEAMDNLTLRAGAGIYSGGNPNVWLSNSYQNDGVTTIQIDQEDVFGTEDPVLLSSLTFIEDEEGLGRPFYGVPQSFFDEVAGGSANADVNAVDPNFEIPSQWKAAFGATYDFGLLGGDYVLNVDYLFTKDRNAAGIIDATLEQIGTAPDGRPLYDQSGPNDYILVNNEGGRSHIISAFMTGAHQFADAWDFDWSLGYAFTDAKDRNPMTSAVAFSNFTNFATSDPNNPGLASSNYEVPHRFTVQAGVSKAFFGDYKTRMNLIGVISQSRPYSFVFDDDGGALEDLFFSRQLAYIPSGVDDPNVVFAPGVDTDAFFATISSLGLDEYAGQIAPRNGFQSPWFSQWDLRIEQEVPGLFEDNRGAFFVVIDNLGNLINDEWGVINQAGFPGSVDLIDLNEGDRSEGADDPCPLCEDGSVLDAQGRYVINDFDNVTPDDIFSPITEASVWEIRFGFRYTF